MDVQPVVRKRWKALLGSALFVALVGGTIVGLTLLKRSVTTDPLPSQPRVIWDYATTDQDLRQALAKNDAAAVKRLIAVLPKSALHPMLIQDLADDRYVEVLAAALESGLNPNGFYNEGDALIMAIYRNQALAVKVLLDHGADPNLAPRAQISPLFCALYRDRIPICKMLLAKGARTDDPRLLSAASRSGNLSAMKQFIDQGLSVDPVRPDSGPQEFTPLLEAALGKNPTQAVQLLVSHGANPNAVVDWMEIRDIRHPRLLRVPILYPVAQSGRGEAVRALLKVGADPAKTASNGKSSIDVARGDARLALREVGKLPEPRPATAATR